MINIFLN